MHSRSLSAARSPSLSCQQPQGALPLCPEEQEGWVGAQDGLNLSSAAGQPRPGGPRASPGPRSGVEASLNFPLTFRALWAFLGAPTIKRPSCL